MSFPHDRSITFISDCPRRSSERGTKTIDKRGGKGGEVINGSPKQKEEERRRAINYFYRAGAEMRRLASLLLTPSLSLIAAAVYYALISFLSRFSLSLLLLLLLLWRGKSAGSLAFRKYA